MNPSEKMLEVQLTNHLRVLLHVHCSTLLMGGTALFAQLISMPAVDIIFYRSVVCCVLLWAALYWFKQPVRLRSWQDAGWFFLIGLIFSVHWGTYFHAIQVSSVAVGVISMLTYPVWAVLLEPFFSREALQVKDLISAALVILGVYCLTPELNWQSGYTQGVFWGVLSAILFAVRGLLLRHYLRHYPPLTVMGYQIGMVALSFLPVVVWDLPPVTQTDFVLLLLLAVFFTIIPHTQIAHGLQNLKVKTVSLIGSLQIFYSVVLAWLILGEAIGWREAIGGGLVLIAAITESRRALPGE